MPVACSDGVQNRSGLVCRVGVGSELARGRRLLRTPVGVSSLSVGVVLDQLGTPLKLIVCGNTFSSVFALLVRRPKIFQRRKLLLPNFVWTQFCILVVVCMFVFSVGFERWNLHAIRHVGLFFVRKKGDTQRMIIDARAVNERFRTPPALQMTAPEGLSRLEAGNLGELYVASKDVDNFFHRLRCLVNSRSGLPWSPLPRVSWDSPLTGFSWSAYLAQWACEETVRESILS